MHALQGGACLALPTQDIQMVNEMTVYLLMLEVNLGVKTWPGLLEAWLALTSVKYHGNL